MTCFLLKYLSLRSLVAVGLISLAIADDNQIKGPCPMREGTEAYHHVDVFGEGIGESIPANKTVCFMIAPKDADDKRIDQHCEPPSTAFVVLVKSLDGRIHTRAPLMNIPHEGFQMACYRLPEPGEYRVSIYLVSLDHAGSLHHKNLSPGRFPLKLVKTADVTSKAEDPDGYAQEKQEYLASVPVCSAKTRMEWRGGEGRWIDNYWHPYNCQLKRISPGDARKCLAGKRILLIGDTQQLAAYSTALAFLSSADECTFAEDLEGMTSLPTIRCDKMRVKGPTPFRPDSDGKMKVGVHRTEFDNGVTVTFYGTAANGFGIGRVPPVVNASAEEGGRRRRRRRMLENTWLQTGLNKYRKVRSRSGLYKKDDDDDDDDKGKRVWVLDARPNLADGSLLSKLRTEAQVTEMLARQKGYITVAFVAHTRASDVLYRDWMVDPRRKGPLVYDYSPFDHVLATSGVHDLFVFDSVQQYENALDNEYFPSLRLAVKGDAGSSVTWMGAWSIDQNHLKEDKLPSTNVGRAIAFDRATERVSKAWEIPFIDTEPLTQSRPDLSIGPAHYAWPVGRAVLELWLGTICPDAESKPTSTCPTG